MNEKPIIITGIQRSGLSMIAACLHSCGAEIGETVLEPKRSAFENKAMMENIIDPYLTLYGISGEDSGRKMLPTHSLPKWRILDILERQRALDLPWMIKSSKMMLIWRQWLEAFPETRWIIVHRDADEVIRSCMNTSYMTQRKDRRGWAEWVRLWSRFEDSLALFGELSYINNICPREVLKGDYSQLKIVVGELGLKWNQDRVENLFNRRCGK